MHEAHAWIIGVLCCAALQVPPMHGRLGQQAARRQQQSWLQNSVAGAAQIACRFHGRAARQGYTPEIATILASFTYFLCDTLDAVRLGKYGMLVGHHLPALVLFGSQVRATGARPSLRGGGSVLVARVRRGMRQILGRCALLPNAAVLPRHAQDAGPAPARSVAHVEALHCRGGSAMPCVAKRSHCFRPGGL